MATMSKPGALNQLRHKFAHWTTLPVDVHLMVEEPMAFIPPVGRRADAISVHPETISREAFRVINTVRQAGKQVGMVLNPATPLETLSHYLPPAR